MPVIAPVLSTDVAVTVAPDPGQSLPQATLNTVPLAYPEPPEIRDADPIPRPDRYVPVKPDPPPPDAERLPSPYPLPMEVMFRDVTLVSIPEEGQYSVEVEISWVSKNPSESKSWP